MNSKSACDSVQVQTVPGSSHHNVTQKYCYYSSFPCFTEAWGCVTAVYSTAKKHHLFDPAARYCFEAHTLKSTHLLNQIFLIKPLIHTFLVFLIWWKPKGEGWDATGTYVDLVWCQQGRLGHLCARSKHLLLAIAYLRHQKKLLQRMLSLWISSSHHLRMQPLFLQPKERLWQTAFVGTTTPHNLSAEFRVKPVLTTIFG